MRRIVRTWRTIDGLIHEYEDVPDEPQAEQQPPPQRLRYLPSRKAGHPVTQRTTNTPRPPYRPRAEREEEDEDARRQRLSELEGSIAWGCVGALCLLCLVLWAVKGNKVMEEAARKTSETWQSQLVIEGGKLFVTFFLLVFMPYQAGVCLGRISEGEKTLGNYLWVIFGGGGYLFMVIVSRGEVLMMSLAIGLFPIMLAGWAFQGAVNTFRNNDR